MMNRKILPIAFAMLFLFLFLIPISYSQPAFNSSIWENRRNITITQPYTNATSLNNWIHNLSLDTSSVFLPSIDSGCTIGFYNDTGHELSWRFENTTQCGETASLKILNPIQTSNTSVIWLYWNNTTAYEPPRNIFDSSYVAVYWFNSSVNNNASFDQTDNQRDFQAVVINTSTPSSSICSGVVDNFLEIRSDGVYGDGAGYVCGQRTPTGEKIGGWVRNDTTFTTFSSLMTYGTIYWFGLLESPAVGSSSGLAVRDDSIDPNNYYSFGRIGNTGTLLLTVKNGGSETNTFGHTVVANDWTHYGMYHDGSTDCQIWQNGTRTALSTSCANFPTVNTNLNASIGYVRNGTGEGDENMKGGLDELYIRDPSLLENDPSTILFAYTVGSSAQFGSAETAPIPPDVTAPLLENFTETPSSPQSQTGFADLSVTFNADVFDETAIDTVLLNINGTNVTMLNTMGNTYGGSRDVPCGNTDYSFFANDTSGNENISSIFIFTLTCTAPSAVTTLGSTTAGIIVSVIAVVIVLLGIIVPIRMLQKGQLNITQVFLIMILAIIFSSVIFGINSTPL